ncbi:hypothetical protein [Pandoraea pnomenusa]|uniref:tetratricopeptide repeat protein n=1 Tax=Pandoraea pnomenusa TaxID=93220 RepID=UPI00333F8C07
MDLNPDQNNQIKALCGEGDALIEGGEFTGAFERFAQALSIVPEPKEECSATVGILAGLGDVYFFAKSFEQCCDVMSDAMHCVGGIGNPFLHLRLGQSHFELGNVDRAADELARAYMGAGKEIFDREDSKYFDFLKTKLLPPVSGEW